MSKTKKIVFSFLLILSFIFVFCFSAFAASTSFTFDSIYSPDINSLSFTFRSDISYSMKPNSKISLASSGFPNGYWTQPVFVQGSPTSEAFYNSPFTYSINFTAPDGVSFNKGDYFTFQFPVYVFTGSGAIFDSAKLHFSGIGSFDHASFIVNPGPSQYAKLYIITFSGYLEQDSSNLNSLVLDLFSDSYPSSTWKYIGIGFYDYANFYSGEKTNVPQYSPPNSTEINNYTDAEAELVGMNTNFLDKAFLYFENFSSNLSATSNLAKGMLFVSRAFMRFQLIPLFDKLLVFSLSLGLFAFLIGVSVYVVRRGSKH